MCACFEAHHLMNEEFSKNNVKIYYELKDSRI